MSGGPERARERLDYSQWLGTVLWPVLCRLCRHGTRNSDFDLVVKECKRRKLALDNECENETQVQTSEG